MLKLLPAVDAERLCGFLEACNYTETAIAKTLTFVDNGLGEPGISSQILHATREPTAFNLLLRWFWLGQAQAVSDLGAQIPSWFCDLAAHCGLLRQEGSRLVPPAMLLPLGGIYIASDQKTSNAPDLVSWPNPTSRVVSNFTIRKAVPATLDLGTGNGIQALAAARHSQSVIATDLNPRAIEFARFNACLNRIENIEFRVGDGFRPVAGTTFDLIVSNPPFYITPSNDFMFCDNSMELDGLCRLLAREAAGHLNEGGCYQMICEWVQVRGQPWQERVQEWFDGTGCDVLILKGGVADPAEYAEKRIRKNSSTAATEELYDQYMCYYDDKGVEAIHNGLIAMRRRSGNNWLSLRDMPQVPAEPFGDSVLAAFFARDCLAAHSTEDEMLTLRPKLTPHARLEQVLQSGGGRWQSCSLNLRLIKGLPAFVAVQPMVADFLAKCDGTKTLGDLTRDLAGKANAPAAQVQKECLAIVRRMMEQGFLEAESKV